MSDPFYACDAHTLIWYLAADRKLSPRGRKLLDEAERGLREVGVPVIALMEAVVAIERGRARVSFTKFRDALRESGLIILPFDEAVFAAALELPSAMELHDRVIVATAKANGAVLISRDPEIAAVTKTVWK